MTTCLSVCLLACLQKYYRLEPSKSEDGTCSNLDPIKFESDLDHRLKVNKCSKKFPFTYYFVPY